MIMLFVAIFHIHYHWVIYKRKKNYEQQKYREIIMEYRKLMLLNDSD